MAHKEEILRLSAQGFSYNQISKALNCSKGTVAYHLGEGQVEKTNSRRRVHKKKISEYLQNLKNTTPCADCGSSYPYWVMDFDHVRGKKRFNIAQYSNMVISLEAVQEEVAKCEIVCSNCHRHRTHIRWINQLEDVPSEGGKDLRTATG